MALCLRGNRVRSSSLTLATAFLLRSEMPGYANLTKMKILFRLIYPIYW